MRVWIFPVLFLSYLMVAGSALATVFGTVQGVVHDPSHRPVSGANITLHAVSADYKQSARTSDDGQFEFRAVPAGEYRVGVAHPGFTAADQNLTVVSGNAPVVHFQLRIAQQNEIVESCAGIVGDCVLLYHAARGHVG